MNDTSFWGAGRANDGAEIIQGVYDLNAWFADMYVRKSAMAGISTTSVKGSWITKSEWRFQDWIHAQTVRYNFTSSQNAFAFFPWGFAECKVSSGKLEIAVTGQPEPVAKFMEHMDRTMPRAENLIEWIYSTRGDSISVPLNYRPAVPGAYPWLPMELNDYIDAYINSSASILVLLGPPGTGKTSFCKQLIHRSGSGAKVTYDEKVMSDDSLFAGFIEDDAKFLVMEDADAFLKSREDGNTMMHRFLNVSDGLISAKDKKLVFSTNLPSIRDIDSALLRPGRCFDVIEFRPLTRTEATVVVDQTGLVLPDGDKFTLAELFSAQPSTGTQTKRTMGFV